ncbi:sodium channel protein Nach [Megalopta genalis]|uniref:sodium channel protein Nach n=1 Tax=Megalopta genalis TaxID=115081 RepID=UPI003FD195AC
MPRKFASRNQRLVPFKGDLKRDFGRRISPMVKIIGVDAANEAEPAKKQEHIPTTSEIVNDFLESTSIHGLQYFGKTDMKVGFFGKILWTCTILTGFACSAIMVIQFLNRYNENPTNTFIKSFNNPIFNAPFPAVTLCPLSPIPRERREKILHGINIPENMSVETVENLLKYGHIITLPYATQSYDESYRLEELLAANYWTIADFLKILQPCDDMLESCWWSSERIDCKKSLLLSHSSYGLCCSFNYLLEDFVGRDKNQPVPKPIRSVDYGRRSGLKLLISSRTLGIDSKNRSRSIKPVPNGNGIGVFVHHSLDFPGLNTNAYILQKSTEMQVSVNPTIIEKPTDLHHRNRYGKVVPICVKDADGLEYFPIYTYSNCYANCRVKAMIRICGCLPFIYEHLVNYYRITSCGLEGLSCIQKNTKEISIIRDVKFENLTCTCRTPCVETVYDALPNSIELSMPQAAITYKNVSSRDAILRVFMKSQVFVTTETVSAADEVYLLASIGGIFSLFLGCSFLSVVEILYFIKLFCRAKYLRWKNSSAARKQKRTNYEGYGNIRRNIY